MTEPFAGNTAEASDFEPVSTKQERIAALARQSPGMAFTSLNHHLDLRWLWTACLRTRRDAATGVDGRTWDEYYDDWRANLGSLLERAKSGSYFAPPVRRLHIAKAGSATETRPIGIPTIEDKVLQRAVVMLLEPIYEQDFHDGSYGDRPGRTAHQALDAWRETLLQTGGGWVLEVDISKFFDSLDHAHLREFLRRRVRDGVLLRLIGKWLNAGVLEDGTIHYPEQGSPQGGVISPLLANIYLHYVLDAWFADEVAPTLRGRGRLIRFADDFVIAFTNESDARRVHAAIAERFAAFGLTLHPAKTRLPDFRHPGHSGRRSSPGGPETFDLPGFTVYWGRTRNGGWTVKTRTAASRFRRSLRSLNLWCRRHRHDPIPEQHEVLVRKLHGHYQYFGRIGNYDALARYARLVTKLWHKWLSRRSWKGYFNWSAFRRLLARHPLPRPRIATRASPAGEPGA